MKTNLKGLTNIEFPLVVAGVLTECLKLISMERPGKLRCIGDSACALIGLLYGYDSSIGHLAQTEMNPSNHSQAN